MMMIEQFLEGAEVVRRAISHPLVQEGWDLESTLEGQTIGSLAGHLARGSVWVVEDYLGTGEPAGEIVYDSAAAYFVLVGGSLSEADHAAIRNRGREVASVGFEKVNAELTVRLDRLRSSLPGIAPDRKISVYQSNVMRLDDYLWTRIVEQVVHLDDLAESLGIEPWTNPPDAAALTVSCGAEVARRRHGDSAMIRAIFRQGDALGKPSI